MSRRKMRAVVRVVIYTRISETDLATETPESDRQEYEIRETLDDTFGPEGWEPVAHHYDAESAWAKVRGRDGEFVMKPRPGFSATLALASARQVDVVATWSSDRLCRTVKTATEIIDALGTDPDDGVQWVTAVDDRIDLTTASGRKRAQELAADAEFESARKSERIRSALRYAARQGWAPPQTCYGFVRENWGPKRGATFHQVPDEAIAVRSMAEAFLLADDVTALTLREVADQLNDQGLFRRGVPWTGPGCYKLLHCPTLAGLIADPANEGQYLPGNWKGIVTPEEWEDIKAVLADPERHHKRKRGVYWLRPNLVDQNAVVMVGGRHNAWEGGKPVYGERRYYRTSPTAKTPGATSTNIDADAVEAWAYDTVELVLPLLAAMEDAQAGPPVLSAEEAEAEALEAELHELSAMKGAGELTMGEWRAQRKKLLPRVEAAQRAARSARRARRRPTANLFDVAERWHRDVADGGLTLAQKHAVIRRVLGPVTVLPATAAAGRFRATAETVTARLVFAEGSLMAEALARH